jgi:hypothetical protein
MGTTREQDPEQRPGTSVTVELDWNALEPSIDVVLNMSLGAAGFDFTPWANGAVYGARFALDCSNALPCAARIREIAGDFESTNATIVAAATAHAIWEAIEFQPPPEVLSSVENAVQRSREAALETLVQFGA